MKSYENLMKSDELLEIPAQAKTRSGLAGAARDAGAAGTRGKQRGLRPGDRAQAAAPGAERRLRWTQKSNQKSLQRIYEE